MRVITATLLILVSACTAPEPPPPPIAPFQQGTRVIFHGWKGSILCGDGSIVSGIFDSWNPTDADIDALERTLGNKIKSELVRVQGGPIDDSYPRAFYRQYGGRVVDGQRIICVNGLHRLLIEDENYRIARDWRNEPIFIGDGGPIAFQAIYDPATRTYRHFHFNGVA
jgi:hypothetical protein